ncbi:MAG TPA: hypothetical protein P5147_13835, partial [Myxococcota bacterium]|nr:hypothetical protein [Myxococcota bacterium]
MRKISIGLALLACLLVVRAQARPGAYQELGGGWDGVGGMVGLDGKLYVISGGKLWATEKDGKYKDLGGGWAKIGGMAALDGKLYVISGGKLWATEK